MYVRPSAIHSVWSTIIGQSPRYHYFYMHRKNNTRPVDYRSINRAYQIHRSQLNFRLCLLGHSCFATLESTTPSRDICSRLYQGNLRHKHLSGIDRSASAISREKRCMTGKLMLKRAQQYVRMHSTDVLATSSPDQEYTPPPGQALLGSINVKLNFVNMFSETQWCFTQVLDSVFHLEVSQQAVEAGSSKTCAF